LGHRYFCWWKTLNPIVSREISVSRGLEIFRVGVA
jgi:hypothetical protein